jgi:hypothetical protein
VFLDLDDDRLRVRVTSLADGRRRLVIDYPPESHYRDSIFNALSDLLRPRQALINAAKGTTHEGGVNDHS